MGEWGNGVCSLTTMSINQDALFLGFVLRAEKLNESDVMVLVPTEQVTECSFERPSLQLSI